jgi:uncharacterized FlaG/YvyC family protein
MGISFSAVPAPISSTLKQVSASSTQTTYTKKNQFNKYDEKKVHHNNDRYDQADQLKKLCIKLNEFKECAKHTTNYLYDSKRRKYIYSCAINNKIPNENMSITRCTVAYRSRNHQYEWKATNLFYTEYTNVKTELAKLSIRVVYKIDEYGCINIVASQQL